MAVVPPPGPPDPVVPPPGGSVTVTSAPAPPPSKLVALQASAQSLSILLLASGAAFALCGVVFAYIVQTFKVPADADGGALAASGQVVLTVMSTFLGFLGGVMGGSGLAARLTAGRSTDTTTTTTMTPPAPNGGGSGTRL